MAAGPAATRRAPITFASHYHQPSDEFSDAWDIRGPVDVTTLYHLSHGITDSGEWPTWNADSEFHAEREKSAALRAATTVEE